MRILAVVLFAVLLLTADTLPYGPGLATNYPGDAGIETDSRVVQVKKFKQPDIVTLAAQWESVGTKDSWSFTGEVTAGSAGNYSIIHFQAGIS